MWCDAISDDTDPSELFDVFGDCKGRTPNLDVSSAETWCDAVTPDQHLRTKVEEATFICAEHARTSACHFDNDNFHDVILVRNTKIDDAPSSAETHHLMPPRFLLSMSRLLLSRSRNLIVTSHVHCLAGKTVQNHQEDF